MANLETGMFIAIRMIVLKEDVDPQDFKDFVAGELRPAMTESFPAMRGFVFLEGNKAGRPTHESQPNKKAAGANADYAWLTFWNSVEENQEAWQGGRATGWHPTWRKFLGYCYEKETRGHRKPVMDVPITRPLHGPPYDYLGDPWSNPPHHGRGAGCLVEGFKVLWSWSKM